MTFRHEKLKGDERIPAARRYIVEHALNELFDGTHADVGIIVQGGLYNSLIARAAAARPGRCVRRERDAAAGARTSRIRWCPSEIVGFCAASARCSWSRKASPSTSSRRSRRCCAAPTCRRALHGKDLLPTAGEYTRRGDGARAARSFVERYLPDDRRRRRRAPGSPRTRQRRATSRRRLGTPLPARPPSFCIGCPERPVFAALKLAQQDVGPVHIAADIGCHAFATFEPFSSGHSILGYGMSLASSAGVVADDAAARAVDHGRRRLLAQRPAHRRAVGALQRRRLGAADHQERLHVGDRHAGDHLDARRRRARRAPPTSQQSLVDTQPRRSSRR